MKLKTNKSIWEGLYRGIHYEIHKWYRFSDEEHKKYKIGTNAPIWNFYIYLNLSINPKYKQKLLPKKNKLYADIIIQNLEWHGGITYYDFTSSYDKNVEVVKVGCDYNHYWDEGINYNESNIEFDAHQCINSIVNKYPDFNVRDVTGLVIPIEKAIP